LFAAKLASLWDRDHYFAPLRIRFEILISRDGLRKGKVLCDLGHEAAVGKPVIDIFFGNLQQREIPCDLPQRVAADGEPLGQRGNGVGSGESAPYSKMMPCGEVTSASFSIKGPPTGSKMIQLVEANDFRHCAFTSRL
jgi:hypothetical protein